MVVLEEDLPQGLHPGAGQQVRVAGGQVIQQPAGIRPGLVHPGLRPGGVLAEAGRAAVAAAPVVTGQAFQRVPGGAGELLQGGAHRLGDQLQAGQVPHRRPDVGGVGALGSTLADQPGLLQPGQGQVKEPARPPVLQQPVPEAAQHAVMEAGIVKVKAERVLEIDPAPHRLGGIAVRQIEQELQHAHRGQLRRRDPRPPVPGIPPGEVLVLPQAAEPVPHPHRRRPGRVAGPRHPRGQLRDPGPQAGTDRHLILLRNLAGLMSPQDWPRTSLQSAKYQDSRQSQAQSVSHRSSACCASAGRAARGVVVVADSSTIGSSSALRSIPPATARDGQDLQDTPWSPLVVTSPPPRRNPRCPRSPAAAGNGRSPGAGTGPAGGRSPTRGTPSGG